MLRTGLFWVESDLTMRRAVLNLPSCPVPCGPEGPCFEGVNVLCFRQSLYKDGFLGNKLDTTLLTKDIPNWGVVGIHWFFIHSSAALFRLQQGWGPALHNTYRKGSLQIMSFLSGDIVDIIDVLHYASAAPGCSVSYPFR